MGLFDFFKFKRYDMDTLEGINAIPVPAKNYNSGVNIKDKIYYLTMIFNQQNYFIDRHDSMAEKFINVLLVEVSCLSAYSAFRKHLNR